MEIKNIIGIAGFLNPHIFTPTITNKMRGAAACKQT
jgi:hypothetical protein